MTAALVIIAAVAAVLVVLLVGAVRYALELRAQADELRAELEQRALAELVGENVVLITKDRQTIQGDLVRLYDDGVRLDHCVYLSDAGQDIGGSVIVAHENRSWIQHRDDPAVPPAAAE
jgi:type II secretory pathway pseudopilin PulG